MEFEWDEAKRLWVLSERGIDFLLLADALFDGRPVLTTPVTRGDEERFVSLVPVKEKLFAVIWT